MRLAKRPGRNVNIRVRVQRRQGHNLLAATLAPHPPLAAGTQQEPISSARQQQSPHLDRSGDFEARLAITHIHGGGCCFDERMDQRSWT